MRFLTRYFRAIALFIAALALVGCAQVPRGSQAEDANAKQFTPQADTASLYIYREEFFGAALTMNVKVNGQLIGHTGPQSYFHLNVAPGKYKIESVTDLSDSLDVDVAAGKNYFVWQEVKMSVLLTNSKLTRTDEAAGRKGVMGSKLIASKIPGSAIAPMGGPPAAPVAAASAVPPGAAVAPSSSAAPKTATITMPFIPTPTQSARTVAPAPATKPAAAPAAMPVTPAAPNVPAKAAVAVVSPTQPAAAPMSPSKKESRLQWLKQMRDANLVSASEYEIKRQQILSAP